MKKLISVFPLLIASVATFAQKIHSIRFVHGGDEIKPVGTVVISVEKLIKPNIRPLDSTFGSAIQTQLECYNIIDEMVKQSKYITLKPSKIDTLDFLKITDSNGFILVLRGSKYKLFFSDLKDALGNECPEILSVFWRYYPIKKPD